MTKENPFVIPATAPVDRFFSATHQQKLIE